MLICYIYYIYIYIYIFIIYIYTFFLIGSQFILHLVSSGSVTVNSDSSVQILAEEAFPLEELDLQVYN